MKNPLSLIQACLVIFLCLNYQYVSAEKNKEKSSDDLLEMGVEDFFSLYQDVYSTSRKKQKLKNTSSAIYVLTSEDIERSGATILPDVLRLVPGVQVAKISSNNWAISIRGANQLFNQKILVLIDNVPVVTPLFNGVFWESLNMPLETIEKIEVVRGPGAAVWGARALNGVINIITKPGTTKGSKVSVGGGTNHRLSAYAIKDFQLNEDSGINFNIKYDEFDNTETVSGNAINDDWNIVSAGARGDFRINGNNNLRFNSFNFYKDENLDRLLPVIDEPFVNRESGTRYHFGSLTSVLWSHTFDDDSEFMFEWSNYFENLNDLVMDYTLYNTDLDLRYRFKPLKNHEIITGTSFRFYSDSIKGTDKLDFIPDDRTLEFYRAFIHDEIEVIDEKLYLTLGSRFEYNTQIGFSAMPTIRSTWHTTDWLSVWGAVSYTEGIASRINDDIRLPAMGFREPTTGLPALAEVTGNRSGQSENLTAYEIGIRSEASSNIYLDFTGFYFNNRNAITREAQEPVLSMDRNNNPFLLVPLRFDNNMTVDLYGAELALNWTLNEYLRFAGSYTYITSSVSRGNSTDDIAVDFNQNDPRHVFTLRAHADPLESLETDAIIRHVDSLNRTDISGYTELDLRLNWKCTDKLNISVIGRDLLNSSHEEFRAWTFNQPVSRIPRSVFTQVGYKF